MNAAPQHRKEPKELFHYTTISSLQGILKTKTLWATHAGYLNDSSETRLIWNWLREKVAKHYEEEIRNALDQNPDPNAPKLTSVGEANLGHLVHHDTTAIVNEMYTALFQRGSAYGAAPQFIVSFTTHDGANERDIYHRENGMLSQWRGYGRPEGVAIVFDTKGINRMLVAECELFEYWPSRTSVSSVIYDWRQQALESRFAKLYEALQDFVGEMIGRPSDRESQLELMGTLYDHFVASISRLKHRAFHEEKEYRIILGATPKSLLDKRAGSGQTTTNLLKQIHHRRGAADSVPYIRLFDRLEEDLPITRIIVGPSKNQSANLEQIRTLTRPHQIAIHASETPFVESV